MCVHENCVKAKDSCRKWLSDAALHKQEISAHTFIIWDGLEHNVKDFWASVEPLGPTKRLRLSIVENSLQAPAEKVAIV